MSAIPPSCFDWVFQGSGTPITYGGATVFSGTSRVLPQVDNKTLTFMLASGQTHAYYKLLDGRFDTPGSGWNA